MRKALLRRLLQNKHSTQPDLSRTLEFPKRWSSPRLFLDTVQELTLQRPQKPKDQMLGRWWSAHGLRQSSSASGALLASGSMYPFCDREEMFSLLMSLVIASLRRDSRSFCLLLLPSPSFIPRIGEDKRSAVKQDEIREDIIFTSTPRRLFLGFSPFLLPCWLVIFLKLNSSASLWGHHFYVYFLLDFTFKMKNLFFCTILDTLSSSYFYGENDT